MEILSLLTTEQAQPFQNQFDVQPSDAFLNTGRKEPT
jgi:hypothetical protein